MDGSILDGLGCADHCHDWACDNMTDEYYCARPGCNARMSAELCESQAGERDLDLIYYQMIGDRK